MNILWQCRIAAAIACASLMGSAVAQQEPNTNPESNGSPPRLPGAAAPAAIPGYAPSLDRRDFTGVWRSLPTPGVSPFQLAPNIELNAAGRADAARRADLLRQMKGTTVANPEVMCRPNGVGAALIQIVQIYVLQNEREVVFVVTDEIKDVRHVYLNQKHPAHLVPSYGGDSVGHWEGDTLVIDTIGYNGRGTLEGTVHSRQMHLVQRMTKSDDGKTLTIESTFNDPQTMAHPATVTKRWGWLKGQQPLEFDCESNPREDNFAGMAFADDYLRPVCIQYVGEGAQKSKVICKTAGRK
jgi:hypothetical protein